MTAVILANGEFPRKEYPLWILRNADVVVCCDSAYDDWNQENGDWKATIPYVVIGDGDSLTAADKHTLGDRWIEVSEQDYNDLHKAMEYATSHFAIHNSKFDIIGATGRREDHTLGNISYLVTFAEEHPGIELEMLTNHGRFCAMRGSRTYSCFPRQQISIFTMTPDVPIYGTGLRWPLDGFHARRWWQATLNEALGTEFSLSSEGWLVLFRTYEAKR